MKTQALMAAAMIVALAACDRAPRDEAPGTTPAQQAGGASTSRGASDAVTAVLQSTGEPLARLSFLLETRPEVNKPFEVVLRVSSAAALPELQVTAESPGLAVTPATASLALEAGAPASHTLTVTAREAGLTEMIVRLKAGDAPPAIYSIPLLVAAAGS